MRDEEVADGGGDERLATILARSRAAGWSDRVGAVHSMTRHNRIAPVFERLTEMLADQDEAVIMAAAEALLVGPADAGAAAVLSRQAIADDFDVTQAIADVMTEAARYPYVFERLVGVADDQRLPREVRIVASDWVRELSREGYPLASSIRAYLRSKQPVGPFDEES